ncbi:MAG: hypothetical protein VX874_10220 [Pseudomonadota bacterium]|nr:hypothetical protein [Pseudomonadota bacterium]
MTGQSQNRADEVEEFARAATEVIGADLELLRESRRVEALLQKREMPAAVSGGASGEASGPQNASHPIVLRFSNLFRKRG